MKKLFTPMICFFTVTMLLMGCGNSVADESQLKADLEDYLKTDFSTENEQIVEINIDRRKTEKDKQLDMVWCTVKTEDEKCAYEKSMILTYNLYDEGGWILDNVSVNSRNEWNIMPLAGVDNDEIIASLNRVNVTADNELWYITQENIKNISVDKHETDLEAETDIVTVTLTIDDLVAEASGQLVISYMFNNGNWTIDSLSGNEGFTTDTKSGFALNVTEETLVNELTGITFDYGLDEGAVIWYTSDLQTITIDKNEISDFTIKSQESSSKGTIQNYLCDCIVKKPHAEFALSIEVQYYYSGEWNLRPIFITAQCTSMNIEGEWMGTYGAVGGGGTAVLNISAIDDNGLIMGTFRYTPNRVDKYSQPGSYSITGEINLATLYIHFTAGEWIDDPGINSMEWDLSDITVRLNAEDSIMYGTASSLRTIKVTQ